MSDFAYKVYAVVKTISRGQVMSYGEVARLAGSPRASRAVGRVLSKNYDPQIPCHRVIHSDGRTGQYNRGAEVKKALLQAEGWCGSLPIETRT